MTGTGGAPVVHLVDDEPGVLKALSRLLNGAGFAVKLFHDPAAFLAACSASTRGCAVLDLALPGMDGLTVQSELLARGCVMPVVFLTGRGGLPASVQAMRNGARDFLAKPVDGPVLVAAVQAALDRDASQWRDASDLAAFRTRLARLTPREREVVDHVLTGQLNKQIASDLGTTEKTVKVHRARAMEKLEVVSVAQLARLAERAGLTAAR